MANSTYDPAVAETAGAVAGPGDLALNVLLEKVYRDGGYDFREYKPGTVSRRLARRLYAVGVNTYREYADYLDHHRGEYQKLAEDLTLNVSGFFRSQGTFRQLSRLVLSGLSAGNGAAGMRAVSFWSAGCARGEEPYSIAILLAEFLGQKRPGLAVSIFATDISRTSLDQARAGKYCLQDLHGLPGAMRENYFTRHGEHYELRADIRQMVTFAHFDLTSTAPSPFSGIDCIFCCNVLIYWQRRLQDRVLQMLCDALATRGYLVLGEAEAPTNNVLKRLECLDSRAKIYRKVN